MNPYAILGVSTTATDLEIKRAYRNLVKRYHPDSEITRILARTNCCDQLRV
jgi:molecular chaperone DnaJ